MEQTKEKKYIVGSILCGLLTAFGIVANIISFMSGPHAMQYCDCGSIVILALISYYAISGYKKPHGNLLKYIILLQGVLYLLGIPHLVQTESVGRVVLVAAEIGLLCYIAGRLAKVKENLVLMSIVFVCMVICNVPDITSGDAPIGIVSVLVVWLDICVAYFLRYKQHREAGLEDAPKNK